MAKAWHPRTSKKLRRNGGIGRYHSSTVDALPKGGKHIANLFDDHAAENHHGSLGAFHVTDYFFIPSSPNQTKARYLSNIAQEPFSHPSALMPH